jgi:hypothetical protein
VYPVNWGTIETIAEETHLLHLSDKDFNYLKNATIATK